ncbi:MAG: transglutaminase family protein [Candidatus Competibacteraceae bacterium]
MADAREIFEQALAHHDALIERQGLAIWVGGEPTFTDPLSLAPEWMFDALGQNKESRARKMLAELARSLGGRVLRTLGRQYPGEKRPRWSLGLYCRRDQNFHGSGPPDPLLLANPCRKYSDEALVAFWVGLEQRLHALGWAVARYCCERDPVLRLVFRPDGRPPPADPSQDGRLERIALHSQAIPPTGLRDALALEGNFLVAIGAYEALTEPAPVLELPAFPSVDLFERFLRETDSAALESGLESLVLMGFPPPVDATVYWTTLTPDPAVVEVNMAPAATVAEFLAANRTIFSTAAGQGLSPRRFLYNGQVTDSGGGGQLTLGGPSPAQSPFLLRPRLLPDLIRYFTRHPALSYYFASDFVGGSSQSPRPDEGTRTAFAELSLALELLSRQAQPTPDMLWSSLAPFLCDPAGNTHRSGLNIEKLWNPYLPNRGCLGLVEFRAFRMASTPERSAALAALLRAILALLESRGEPAELKDWGDELHERFALPYFLQRDLEAVLAELNAAELGLGPAIAEQLMDDDYRLLGRVEFQDCRLDIRRALEFWPLVGDVASQESGTSRLVDASTHRIEVTLRAASGSTESLESWRLQVDGYELPLRLERDAAGPVRLAGLRYRNFVPGLGLHPGLGAHGPVRLILWRPEGTGALRITLHDWEPHGRPYDGLPADDTEARRRREERLVSEWFTGPVEAAPLPPARALTPYCLDLRWL